MKTIITLFAFLTIFSVNTVAQDFDYKILKGHRWWVKSVSFSPDGTTLASGSADGTVRLWNAHTGEHIRTLSGHTDWVGSVSFSPDGTTLASGSDDNTVRLWNARTGEHIRTLSGHTDWVLSVSFSPDGTTLASAGGLDGTVRLWNARTGQHIRTLSRRRHDVWSVSFSPDGITLASGGSPDNTVRLWNVRTGQHVRTLSGHRWWVLSVSFSPDGTTLASGSRDETIRLWNAHTGEHIRTLSGHTDAVWSVSFSPDGITLASGSADGTVRLWDTRTGEHIRTLSGHTGWVESVSFSPDSNTLASGSRDETIRLWEFSDTRVGITPDPVVSPAIGEQFTLDVSIVAGENVGGYQVSLEFDLTVLRYISSANGDYLAPGAFFVPPVVSGNKVTLGATSLAEVSSGDGTLATVTFEVIDVTESFLNLSEVILTDSEGEHLPHLAYGAEIIEPGLLPSSAVISLMPSSVSSPSVGEQLTFKVEITGGQNVVDFQRTFDYDSSALEFISTSRGNYLEGGIGNGDGTLETVTFEVLDVKTSIVSVSGHFLATDGLRYLPIFESAKVEVPSLFPSSAVVGLTPSVVLSPSVGEQLTFKVEITGGQNVVDFQRTFDYDSSALEFISTSRGNYLEGGVGNGDGTLETVTFEVLDVKTSIVSVSGYLVATDGLRYLPTFESAEVVAPIFGDVNRDGTVNILDLVQVASRFGQMVSGDPADVNEDGVVNIVDLVKVAGALGSEAAAPSVWNLDLKTAPTRADVQNWLSQARQLKLTDATSQRGILFLEQLLAALTPKETALLANYPNPFNPETWIPYQLAKASDVKITIYDTRGVVVRTLALGHQPPGFYNDRSLAAYWDGKNAVGEPVVSAVYFYTLTAGDFTATRKLLIRK